MPIDFLTTLLLPYPFLHVPLLSSPLLSYAILSGRLMRLLLSLLLTRSGSGVLHPDFRDCTCEDDGPLSSLFGHSIQLR